jgi:hypothetical protein
MDGTDWQKRADNPRIGPPKNRKSDFDRSVDRSVECHFGLCL